MNDNGTNQAPPKKAPPKPPEVSPFLFPFLLAAFGLWCFYDGWITSDPEMQKHALFNRVVSIVLLPWAVYDFLKVRRYAQKEEPPPSPRGDADNGPSQP